MSDTVFHKIIRREIPAAIVKETEELIAIRDVNPVAPTHILIIPKKSLPNISAGTSADEALLGRLLLAAKDIASEQGIAESGYRIVINNGDQGGQTVGQLHLHLLGGRSMLWPPG